MRYCIRFAANTKSSAHTRLFENKEVDYELLFNTIIYINNEALPSKIWIKRVSL